MADSGSSSSDLSTIDNITSTPVDEAKNSSSDDIMTITLFVNGKSNKCKITSENYRQLQEKLFVLEQIKCEERLVYEQMNRLNAEKQHLQKLLNILHATNTNNKMKNSKRRQRRLQQSDSNSHLN
jgi:plasmid maintenance system killer protein